MLPRRLRPIDQAYDTDRCRETVRSLMKGRGIPREVLAAQLKCSSASVSAFLAGKRELPLFSRNLLCSAFDAENFTALYALGDHARKMIRSYDADTCRLAVLYLMDREGMTQTQLCDRLGAESHRLIHLFLSGAQGLPARYWERLCATFGAADFRELYAMAETVAQESDRYDADACRLAIRQLLDGMEITPAALGHTLGMDGTAFTNFLYDRQQLPFAARSALCAYFGADSFAALYALGAAAARKLEHYEAAPCRQAVEALLLLPGMSQQALASGLGIAESSLSNFLSGQRPLPSYAGARLCGFFGARDFPELYRMGTQAAVLFSLDKPMFRESVNRLCAQRGKDHLWLAAQTGINANQLRVFLNEDAGGALSPANCHAIRAVFGADHFRQLYQMAGLPVPALTDNGVGVLVHGLHTASLSAGGDEHTPLHAVLPQRYHDGPLHPAQAKALRQA